MKNVLKITFLFGILSFLISCDKDSDSNSNGEGIQGDWTAVSINVDITTTTELSGFNFVSTTNTVGENMNYDLFFGATTFETSGSYTAISNSVINGIGQPQTTTEINNIMGSGTYTSTDSEITADGQLFTFESNGMNGSASEDAQTVAYEITSGGMLVFSQQDTIVNSSAGTQSTTILNSQSVFERK